MLWKCCVSSSTLKIATSFLKINKYSFRTLAYFVIGRGMKLFFLHFSFLLAKKFSTQKLQHYWPPLEKNHGADIALCTHVHRLVHACDYCDVNNDVINHVNSDVNVLNDINIFNPQFAKHNPFVDFYKSFYS